ncbi:MAG TPA: DM13 domain-containing protein [Herpetosiphonaceae bacterium]
MTPVSRRKPLLWAAALAAALIGAYLAFAVFEVQALWTNTTVNEAAPGGREELARGAFHDVVHASAGSAIVFRDADGSRSLRLEDFSVDNGPDLYVYAVAAPDAADSASVEQAGFVNLGPLKANQGNQNYELPAEFDPARHQSIVIWCQRFGVNFAAAPLR